MEGIQLLKIESQLKINEKKLLLEKYEKMVDFLLPSYFKLFFQMFETGVDNILYPLYENEENEMESCASIIYKPGRENNKKLWFSGIYNIKELIND